MKTLTATVHLEQDHHRLETITMTASIRVRCRDDGPLLIEGSLELLELVDGEGRPLPIPPSNKGNLALCRCGASQCKPFCDGSHRQQGFESQVREA